MAAVGCRGELDGFQTPFSCSISQHLLLFNTNHGEGWISPLALAAAGDAPSLHRVWQGSEQPQGHWWQSFSYFGGTLSTSVSWKPLYSWGGTLLGGAEQGAQPSPGRLAASNQRFNLIPAIK